MLETLSLFEKEHVNRHDGTSSTHVGAQTLPDAAHFPQKARKTLSLESSIRILRADCGENRAPIDDRSRPQRSNDLPWQPLRQR